jgi:hypothetical protein
MRRPRHHGRRTSRINVDESFHEQCDSPTWALATTLTCEHRCITGHGATLLRGFRRRASSRVGSSYQALGQAA